MFLPMSCTSPLTVASTMRPADGRVFKPRLALFRLHERHQIGHRLLHHARGLHDLRQEHLARAEQVADHVHAVHERAFDDVQGPRGGEAGLFGVGLDVIRDAMDERVLEPLGDRALAPGKIGRLLLRAARP